MNAALVILTPGTRCRWTTRKAFLERLTSFLSFNRRLTDSWKVSTYYGALATSRNFPARRSSVRSKVYLNVGCGPNIQPNFINLDYDWAPGIDLCWSLRKPLPFADGLICLQQALPGAATYSDCLNALREFKRVLRPGGTLRVAVPDANLYQKHKAGEQVSFPYVQTPPPEDYTTLMEINRVFRERGLFMRMMRQLLVRLLSNRAGRIYGRADPVLLIDTPERAIESL